MAFCNALSLPNGTPLVVPARLSCYDNGVSGMLKHMIWALYFFF